MKYKFALSNLFVSLLIALSFLIFADLVWFPHSLSQLNGFHKSAILLISINLVLGPLLILLIYEENKKHLRLDLLVLGLIQISALAFGMYSIYQKHPVYAVFTIDRFTLVDARTASSEKVRYKDFEISLFAEPLFAFAKMPKDPIKQNEIFMGHMFKGEPDLDGRPEYYEPYANHIKSIISRSLPLDELLTTFKYREKLKLFLNKQDGTFDSYAYLPLQTNNESAIWVLDKSNAKPVGLLDIDPWKLEKPLKSIKKYKSTTRRWLI